jgi:hypothetical protein
MAELVSLIAEHVYGDTGNVSLGSTRGCGPVQLQIGFVNNIVQHDGIVITDAPSSVTEAVMDWVAKQKAEDQHSLVKASAGFGGLFIR